MPYKQDIGELYLDPTLIQMDSIPLLWPSNHTMDAALDPYVNGKMPRKEISQAIAESRPIRVMGVFDPHFKMYCERQNWIPRLIKVRQKTSKKRFNYERPKLYAVTEKDGTEALVLTVMPGWEYVRHYGWLVRQFMDKYQPGSAQELLEVTYFPNTCASLSAWTDLKTDSQIKAGDIVVLGYVDEFTDMFIKYGFNKIDEYYEPSQSIYGRNILSNRVGQRILLLGVTYSYWGSIVGKIAEGLYGEGACEVIYAAKCGTLSDPDDIYKQLVIPRYYALYTDGRFEFVPNQGNVLRDLNIPDMTGLHVSVPTVVGETYRQREDLHRLGAASIDNEITHIARAAVAVDGGTGTKVRFASMHFSTDYVRRLKERGLPTSHDLSTGGSADAKTLKQQILSRIGANLYMYLLQANCDKMAFTRPSTEEIVKLRNELPQFVLPEISSTVEVPPERQWITVENL